MRANAPVQKRVAAKAPAAKVPVKAKVASKAIKVASKANPATAVAGKVAAKKVQNRAVKAKVASNIVKGKAEGRSDAVPKVQALTGEFLLAVALSIIALVYADGTYATKMRTFIVQFSGISAVFFVLSLLGVSEKAAKPAIYMGALIDLAILLRIFTVKKTSTPSTAESTTEASPFWVNAPGTIIGDISNATPDQGNTGNTTNAAPTTGTPGAIAVAFALAQVGKQYVYAGNGPNQWDCSGLTTAAWSKAGVNIPRTSAEQSQLPSVPISNLQLGDLVTYYSPVHHVAMYIGGGKVVSAMDEKDGIGIRNVNYAPNPTGHRPSYASTSSTGAYRGTAAMV